MKIFYHTSLFLLSFISFNAYSQIAIGGEEKKEKSDSLIKLTNEIAPKRDLKGSTEIFAGTNCSSSFRVLSINGNLYGKPIGERANESKLNTWSYAIGFRNYLTKNFAIEGGISFLKNGEGYKFKTTDSTYNYQTTYAYIAMPIKVYYAIGEEIRFLVGGGIIPQTFNQYKKEQQWITHSGSNETATIKTKNNYNSFVVSACLDASIQIRYSKSWSIYVTPEYRWQLNSSNMKTSAYNHYARTAGVSFGFVYQL